MSLLFSNDTRVAIALADQQQWQAPLSIALNLDVPPADVQKLRSGPLVRKSQWFRVATCNCPHNPKLALCCRIIERSNPSHNTFHSTENVLDTSCNHAHRKQTVSATSDCLSEVLITVSTCPVPPVVYVKIGRHTKGTVPQMTLRVCIDRHIIIIMHLSRVFPPKACSFA